MRRFAREKRQAAGRSRKRDDHCLRCALLTCVSVTRASRAPESAPCRIFLSFSREGELIVDRNGDRREDRMPGRAKIQAASREMMLQLAGLSIRLFRLAITETEKKNAERIRDNNYD